MINNNYSIADKSNWKGRIDSTDDFSSFRWHQWVEIIDLNNNDLKPFRGKLGFAFLGFCSDYGIHLNKGRIGAAEGPRSIREKLSSLPCAFSENVKLFDAGNIICNNSNLKEAQNSLGKAVSRLLDLNLFPILLGGGHEIAFGHYKGILNQLQSRENSPKIGIINFDAHFDIRPYKEGPTSGTMFNQIADLNKSQNLDYSYLCLGIQKHGNTRSLFNTAEELGVEYILAQDITYNDSIPIFNKIDNFIKNQDYIYITICSDVFSSAFAPGVSAPQPLGLNPNKVLMLLNHILKSNKVISFDIAEISPRFDQDNITASLASNIIFYLVEALSNIIK